MTVAKIAGLAVGRKLAASKCHAGLKNKPLQPVLASLLGQVLLQAWPKHTYHNFLLTHQAFMEVPTSNIHQNQLMEVLALLSVHRDMKIQLVSMTNKKEEVGAMEDEGSILHQNMKNLKSLIQVTF